MPAEEKANRHKTKLNEFTLNRRGKSEEIFAFPKTGTRSEAHGNFPAIRT